MHSLYQHVASKAAKINLETDGLMTLNIKHLCFANTCNNMMEFTQQQNKKENKH